jgi:hypothetical protein
MNTLLVLIFLGWIVFVVVGLIAGAIEDYKENWPLIRTLWSSTPKKPKDKKN